MDVRLVFLLFLTAMLRILLGEVNTHNDIGYNWTNQISCSSTNPEEGYPIRNQSRTPQSDEIVNRVCRRAGLDQDSRDVVRVTCCTPAVQLAMIAESRQRLTSTVTRQLNTLRHALVSTSAKFDDYFSQLMEHTKRKLYDTFMHTYGDMFQQNSDIFVEFFNDLYRYQRDTDVDLSQTVDRFFTQLMHRMFRLYNSNQTFTDRYLECMTEHMDSLSPFGEVPRKISVQIRRSFAAFRTFIQGLDVGRDVIGVVIKQKFGRACHDEVANLLYCPYCRGLAGIRPCIGYCLRVIDGCLEDENQLNKIWNIYTAEMMKIINRLAGPFSIEELLREIDYTISDAIMNYQANLKSITDQVYLGCGRPGVGHVNSSARGQINLSETNPRRSVEVEEDLSSTHPDPQSASIRLLQEAEQKLEVLSRAWESLPESICNNLASNSFNETHCWNGVNKQSTRQAEDGSLYTELTSDVTRDGSIITDTAIVRLRIIINRLHRAYAGHNIDSVDTDDDDDDVGSGEGFSGSGLDDRLNEDITFTSSNSVDSGLVMIDKPRDAESTACAIASHQKLHVRNVLLILLALYYVIYFVKSNNNVR